MRPEDCEEVIRIYGQATKTPVEADCVDLIRTYLQGEDSGCFVAESDGRVAGFIIGYIVTLSFGMGKSAWIATIGVDPEFRRHGIGKGLTAELVKFFELQGIRHIFASTKWDSADLLPLFRTVGFERSNFINLVRKVN
jgi:ribosomal protein S18 acetylase RimI-like enzyme